MKSLLGMTYAELQELVLEHNLPKFTAKQLVDWIYRKRVTTFDEMTNLSKGTRQLLSENYEVGYRDFVNVQESRDGTKKYLFPAGRGFVEAAYIPERERATLCVSCQVGCKMNCLFCQTGKQGFEGNLSAGDILNQILHLPEFENLTNFVFMGMGEPMDNYDAIMKALDVMTSEWGLAMSPTRFTVSTSGLIPNMKRFINESRCNLAVSLHSPFHDERAKIMPIEKTYPIREVIHAIRQHDWSGQRRVSFEYIVFKGLNDTSEHIKELARQLGSLRCRVNLIRFHSIPDVPLASPSLDDMVSFRDRLNAKGIIATIRASRGQDIDAACGLLSTKEKNS
ncbi:MAG: 23S rRNA (adenine(2503)-C(2))-methyltransferase RlmN [Bacteroidales bacterium]|nr:23S rRNA (adenine(2503)-C(2))-methyltransferase RlmN [Bacteroidales bacterium]MDY6075906.1 23S rRNA (adenine(2503)-C(2))-methyltransferase RlmN [Bacteroidales bacterium]